MLRSNKVSGASCVAVASLPFEDPAPTDSEARPRAVETDRPVLLAAEFGDTPDRVIVVVR